MLAGMRARIKRPSITVERSRIDVGRVCLLFAYLCVLQVDLHLPPINTVGRRVPTVLSSVTSLAFYASFSSRRAAIPPATSTQLWFPPLLYVYLVCTTYSLMLVEMIDLFKDLHSSIDDFRSMYAFPRWLCYTIVSVASAVLLGVPPLMLLIKRRALRVARCVRARDLVVQRS